ncbi:MAG: serine--tRNA ligase, partial [Candidatus Bathyarchaeia archaeon]
MDIKLIREDPETVRRNLMRRQDPEKLALLDQLIAADGRWRELTTRVNSLRRRRNEISSKISGVIRVGGDASPLKEEAAQIPKLIREAEEERDRYAEQMRYALMRLPNHLHESV